MLAHSRTHNPVIVGSSVHNVRIERLWRDTFHCVLSIFYQLFYFLEEQGKLDPLSEKDLYCLHYVYIPRIGRALDTFQNGWNNHAITIEHCSTPIQLFASGVLENHSLDTTSHNFGDDSDISSVDGTSNLIEVPNTTTPLTTSQEDELARSVNPLQDTTDYAVGLFEQVKQCHEHFLFLYMIVLQFVSKHAYITMDRNTDRMVLPIKMFF